jgi:hypothetical protein
VDPALERGQKAWMLEVVAEEICVVGDEVAKMKEQWAEGLLLGNPVFQKD